MKKALTKVRLSEIIADARPGFASGEHDPSGTIQLRMNNVGTDGSLNWDKVRRVPATARQLETYNLKPNDVVLNATNSPELVGKTTLFAGHTEEVLYSNHFLRLRTDSERLHPAYLARWLTNQWRHKTFLGLCNQWVNQASVRKDDLLQLRIPLPPLSEQKRIADILDKADAIRRKRQDALRTNDAVIYSVYQDWFGNPISNPNTWKTRTVDELCRLVRGSSPRPKGDPRYYGGPVKRLMVEDITRDGRLVTPRIDTLTEDGARLSRPCPAGTVVMVVSGNVGLPAKLAVDACIHDGFVGFLDLNTEEIRPDFLVLTLEMLKVTHERIKAGAVWQNLTTHQVNAMQIQLPPPKRQQEFAEIVARHEQFTTTLLGKGQEEDNLFNSLVQRAFKGEL